MKVKERNAEASIREVARWLAWDARNYTPRSLPLPTKEEHADGVRRFYFSNQRVARVRSPLGVKYHRRKLADRTLIVKAQYVAPLVVRFVVERTRGLAKYPVLSREYHGIEFKQ